jgi:hypothetical protein
MSTPGTTQSQCYCANADGSINATVCTNESAWTAVNKQTQLAVNLANQWILPGVISTANVTISAAATSCNQTAGTFATVTISSSYWASGVLPPPFGATALQAFACFPHS